MIVLLPQIGMSVIFWWNFMETSSVSSLMYMTFSLAIIYGFLYLILIIPLTLSVIKWASELIQWKKITLQALIQYGFHKLSDSFKVYWYMFAYAYLIPALCFITAGFIMLLGLYLNNAAISSIAWILMVFSIIFGTIQWIYRGVKSTFAIGSAIYEEDFSKQRFQNSVSLTHNNWWRILWNFMLVWIISWLLVWLISWLLWSISFMGTANSWIDINGLLQPADQDIQANIESFMGNIWGFSFIKIIIDSISQIITSSVSVFIIIFTLIFYIRLKDEAWIISSPNTDKKIEL
jgi:hypothetical protein